MTIITHGNWRAVYAYDGGTQEEIIGTYNFPGQTPMPIKSIAHPAQWVWTVEILDSNTGEYVYPDCTYECAHCGSCLGCIRPAVFDWGRKEFLESVMRCAASPTGWHEIAPDEDDEVID